MNSVRDVIHILWWVMAREGAAEVTHVNSSPEKVRTNREAEGAHFARIVILVWNCDNLTRWLSLFAILVNTGSCQSLFHLGTNEAKHVNVEAFFWTQSGQKTSIKTFQWPDITIASLNASVLNQSRHPKGLWKDVLRGSTIGRSLIVPLWLFC